MLLVPNNQQFRMRTGTSASATEADPIRRSARLAGEEPPPPPPAEPTPSQLLMMMDERHRQSMTEIMTEFGNHMQAQIAPRPGHTKLSDFQRTQPPKFSFAIDPLEVDDWIRMMEKNLEIARIEEQDKVPFATHYLEGPANIWWDNTKEIKFEGHVVT